MSDKHYAHRDIIAQGEPYVRHVAAMTSEDLHEKSDIAAELAHRDIEIERLAAELEQTRAELREAKEAFSSLEQTHRTEIELHGKTREELTQLRATYAEAGTKIKAGVKEAIFSVDDGSPLENIWEDADIAIDKALSAKEER